MLPYFSFFLSLVMENTTGPEIMMQGPEDKLADLDND